MAGAPDALYDASGFFIRAERSVAQFGRALRSGRRGRKFESCHADFNEKPLFTGFEAKRALQFYVGMLFFLEYMINT